MIRIHHITAICLVLTAVGMAWLTACSSSSETPVYSYEVIHVYPHDPGAFTQGLIYDHGQLYEGTGLYGKSTLRRVDLETGKVLQIHYLPDYLFGEGITIVNDRIFQLTWKSGKGFVYDRDTFSLLQTFTYTSEGWGLTHDGTHLILSDGTAVIRFLDPETFQTVRQITVQHQDRQITGINELEYINGLIWANIWQQDGIALIDPHSGQVRGWVRLEGLLDADQAAGSEDVLNGIAYDSERDRIFVTGKLWPALFEIKLVNG